MQNGYKSLMELASEVERIETSKNDFIVPSEKMRLYDKDKLDISAGVYEMNNLAQGQMATKLGIPRGFYDRMGDFEGLREHAVNELLNDYPGNRMIRTVDGKARAFLSDSYKPMDNMPVLTGILSALEESGHQGNLKVRSNNLTDQRMYLQISFPSLTREIVVGDPVEYGITVTNSETGCGSVEVSSMIWRLVCSNGMVAGSVLKKRHIGKRISDFENYDVFQSDTVRADVEAFRLKFRDILKASITEGAFENQVTLLRQAAGDKVERPETVVKNITKHFQLSDNDGELILSNMVQERNFSRWGVANGITALAHRIENPDRQYDVEKMGHDVITLNPKQWEAISA